MNFYGKQNLIMYSIWACVVLDFAGSLKFGTPDRRQNVTTTQYLCMQNNYNVQTTPLPRLHNIIIQYTTTVTVIITTMTQSSTDAFLSIKWRQPPIEDHQQ